jgi:hypothetical protein
VNRRALGAVVIGGLLPAMPAAALDLSPRAFGVRGGLSLDPDQLHGGLHARFSGGRRLAVQPSLELGAGNGVRLLALNADVHFRAGSGRWRPYAGGGPGLSLYDVTDGVGEEGGLKASLAGSIVVGLARADGGGRRGQPSGREYMLEARAGLGDVPDLKVTLGVTF